MRLGFWNRLALVAWAVGTFALPSWWIISTNAKHSEVMQSGYRTCLAAANEEQGADGRELCWELWVENVSLGYMGWGAWWQAVMFSAVGLLILYGLIALAVVVARWVWRGRTVEAPQSD